MPKGSGGKEGRHRRTAYVAAGWRGRRPDRIRHVHVGQPPGGPRHRCRPAGADVQSRSMTAPPGATAGLGNVPRPDRRLHAGVPIRIVKERSPAELVAPRVASPSDSSWGIACTYSCLTGNTCRSRRLRPAAPCVQEAEKRRGDGSDGGNGHGTARRPRGGYLVGLEKASLPRTARASSRESCGRRLVLTSRPSNGRAWSDGRGERRGRGRVRGHARRS